MYKKQTSILILLFFICSITNSQNEHKEYYESGELKSIVKAKENEEHIFESISYYKNGNISETGEIKKHFGASVVFRKHGYWKYYHENGVIKMEGTFFLDRPTRFWKQYYENGKLENIWEYDSHGDRAGPWEKYYKNGKLQQIGGFIFGKPSGEWKFYHENGKLHLIGEYSYRGGETGEWKEYKENGKLYSSGEMIEGKQSGEWKFYYENGQLKTTIIFEDGKLMNLTELYDMNGNSMDMSTLKNGNGFLKHYNDDVTLFQMTVKDGVIEQDEPVD